MSTSKNISLIALAVAVSMVLLVTSTPPKALSESPPKAASHASLTVLLAAIPQTLVCLIIAKVVSVNSPMSCTAASTSTKLL